MRPWPSATTFTSGEVRAVELQTALHGLNGPVLGWNHTLMHSGDSDL